MSSSMEWSHANRVKRVPFMIRVFSAMSKCSAHLSWNKDGTIRRGIADFFEMRVPAKSKPIAGVATKDVVIDREDNVWIRLFTPVEAERAGEDAGKTFPVVFYFHGGGFALLSPDFIFYDRFCRRLAKECQVIAISVHYRRSPEYRYPTAYDDSFKALKWLQENPNYLPPSADLMHCFLMGDSAGGNIVHHVGVRAGEEAAALKPLRISGLLLLQPFFGGEDKTPSEVQLVNVPFISLDAADWCWKAYLPVGATKDHPACNVFGPHAKDLSAVDLPPLFVAVAELDILRDRNMAYSAWLRKAGKNVQVKCYEGAVHAFHAFQYTSSTVFIRDARNFIENQLK